MEFPFLQTLFLRGQCFALTGCGGIGGRTGLLQQSGGLHARVGHTGILLLQLVLEIHDLLAKAGLIFYQRFVFHLDVEENLQKVPTGQF